MITDAIKSAGACKKGGSSPVVCVLDYTEKATKPGLSLVCTPGNDVEATTGKAASGATLILFTTGLGTPTGNPVCPTIKLATNTALAKRMPDIIDIDCGAIITGEKTIEEMGEEILEYSMETWCILIKKGWNYHPFFYAFLLIQFRSSKAVFNLAMKVSSPFLNQTLGS